MLQKPHRPPKTSIRPLQNLPLHLNRRQTPLQSHHKKIQKTSKHQTLQKRQQNPTPKICKR